ncbi:MAG: hypothetical protein HY292_18790 [Planctomycetes bacterium]|nr:hypothetical protein [Planctomycetota bacterium]
MVNRKPIRPEDRVDVTFTERERGLIEEKTIAGIFLSNIFAKAKLERDGRYHVKLNRNDLEELLGCIAGEANHTKDRALEGELDALFRRLEELMDGYDDGNWQ